MSTRLARSGLLARLGSPRCVAPVQAMATMKPLAREDHKVSQIEFWTKNKALARPMSPHLTIYKFQLTTVLSISHRYKASLGKGRV